ncbi:GGDEF domain-containing protein [Clostridium sp. YIM B02505]|uniref:GGDEF domain-containing protein n=1 Tax=Clostridium yunnanense TaxID=2800325 RepID=A0ABS1EP04_9CLOT|nr:GGDEF domain-containing protein [Clostridium yunnanense]MBK1811116.1 GGDEF domain-containing protein [Clostridium yunnanense]
MEIKAFDDVYSNCSSVRPNFFDFLEADISKIFGEKGAFIVFNVYNSKNENDELYIESIFKLVRNVISTYSNVYGFILGTNDIIITFPNYNLTDIEKISCKVEVSLNNIMKIIEKPYLQLNKFTLKYNQNINSVEDFYELLFDNVMKQEESKEVSRVKLKSIIHMFTNNIRNTLHSYKYANELAFIDDVSGISNHRAGKLFLSKLIEEYMENRKGFAIMFIDGDNLKRYNNISYEAGNQMIRNLSTIIKSSIRCEDKVFRWLSGDEFVVILKDIDGQNTLKLAERVRKAVQVQTKNYIYPTTISVGVTHYPSDGKNVNDLINRAEKANAYAKSIGKNRVIKWNSSMAD